MLFPECDIVMADFKLADKTHLALLTRNDLGHKVEVKFTTYYLTMSLICACEESSLKDEFSHFKIPYMFWIVMF